MPGIFDPTAGVLGFQEFEGSLREESVEGEPRYFRRFVGPSINRHDFLATIFGVYVLSSYQGAACTKQCAKPVPYWLPGSIGCTEATQLNLTHDKKLWPYGWNCQVLNSDDAPGLPTTQTTSAEFPNVTQSGCLVLVEIEYRAVLKSWHPSVHDATYLTWNTPNLADVPTIDDRTGWWYVSKPGIELRTVPGRTFDVVSHNTSHTVQAASGGVMRSELPPEDQANAKVHIHTDEFSIFRFNTPWYPRVAIFDLMGKVNSEVWFGYPRHGVGFLGVEPKEKTTPWGTTLFDLEFKFLARTVPAMGEISDSTSPMSGLPNPSTYRHGGRVGVWNRGYWDVPFPNTRQHWWPILEKGTTTPDAPVTTPGATGWRRPFDEGNFHDLFVIPAECQE